jgi:hypothetical protein
MAASNTSIYPSNSTDALFRAWGLAISTAIQAAGWVKTADTGQINWGTVATPASTNTVAGYEVYQSNDAMTDWYLKIEYGSGSNASYPSIWITVGTGSNGGGTLTGQLSTRFQLATAAQNAATPDSCAFAGGTNWLAISLWYDCSSSQSITFLIERLRDADGAEQDTGIVVLGISSTARYQQLVPKTGTIPAQISASAVPYWPIMAPPGGQTTSLSGTTVGVYTIHPFAQTHRPSILAGLIYFSGAPDISAYATFTVSRYGANVTYLSLGTFTLISTGLALAIRYE